MQLRQEQTKKVLVKVSDNTFTFNTDNGVFSKKGMDFGTRTLIEVLLNENLYGDVLDVGCGYGVIGIILSSFFHGNYDLVDVNKRAIHLTNRNIKRYPKFNGNAFISDAYANIKNKYNVIITNPPIRVGKTKLLEILEGAFDHLEDNGILYFVIRKDQGALSIKKILEEQRQVEIINKDKGYFIFKVK